MHLLHYRELTLLTKRSSIDLSIRLPFADNHIAWSKGKKAQKLRLQGSLEFVRSLEYQTVDLDPTTETISNSFASLRSIG